MTERDPVDPQARDVERRRRTLLIAVAAVAAVVVVGVTALLITIFDRKQEARHRYVRVVEVDDESGRSAAQAAVGPGTPAIVRRRSTPEQRISRYSGDPPPAGSPLRCVAPVRSISSSRSIISSSTRRFCSNGRSPASRVLAISVSPPRST